MKLCPYLRRREKGQAPVAVERSLAVTDSRRPHVRSGSISRHRESSPAGSALQREKPRDTAAYGLKEPGYPEWQGSEAAPEPGRRRTGRAACVAVNDVTRLRPRAANSRDEPADRLNLRSTRTQGPMKRHPERIQLAGSMPSIRTLRKRAGAAPWLISAICIGFPFPQFTTPCNSHSAAPATASQLRQNGTDEP